MKRLALFAIALFLSGCNQNTAPGNDREAQLEPAPPPAPQERAAEALSGVATEILQIETMSDADVASIGGLDGRCTIRLTQVGYPSFVYGGPQNTGIIKLNGKLIPLPAVSETTFEQSGLSVVIRPVDEEFGDDSMREAEIIVMLPGAKDELGYRGYESCSKQG